MSNWQVEALLGGASRPFRGEEPSAIAKRPLTGLVTIHREGLSGDSQADRRVHGGREKAVHCYPLDHHAAWRAVIGDHPLLDDPGAFGSNLAICGLTEAQVHIGDRFRLGTALLELCQPRQPCWKIEHRFGRKGMVAHILTSGLCGFYLRVLEEGEAEAGDRLERTEIGHADWPVARAFATLFCASAQSGASDLAQLQQLDRLAEELRISIGRKLRH